MNHRQLKDSAVKSWAGLLAFVFFGLTLLLASCSDDDSPIADAEEEEETIASRTVLAYVVGDNQSTSSGASDLSSLLKVNIDSMFVGMKSVTDGNLLVLSKLSGDTNSYLFRLKNSKGTVTADTLYTYDDVNPLSDETMLEIITTAFGECPANSYGFAFLSHAEGWVEASTSASSRFMGIYKNTAMDICDFQYVLSASGYHLDFIMYDACFMQSVEVAYELRNEADYFIGSPTEIPGPGADYSVVVPAFFETTDYAEAIAQAYYKPYAEKYNGGTNLSNSNWTAGVSVSVISADALDDLAASSKEVFDNYNFDNKVVDIMRYDRRSSRYYYDLDGLMCHLTDENDDYDAWREVFDKAVPVWLTTEMNYSSSGGLFSMSGASGLSTYIPLSSTSASVLAYYQTYQWSEDTGWGQ